MGRRGQITSRRSDHEERNDTDEVTVFPIFEFLSVAHSLLYFLPLLLQPNGITAKQPPKSSNSQRNPRTGYAIFVRLLLIQSLCLRVNRRWSRLMSILSLFLACLWILHSLFSCLSRSFCQTMYVFRTAMIISEYYLDRYQRSMKEWQTRVGEKAFEPKKWGHKCKKAASTFSRPKKLGTRRKSTTTIKMWSVQLEQPWETKMRINGTDITEGNGYPTGSTPEAK